MSTTCRTCAKYRYCWDRSRGYPYTIYDSMTESSEEKLRNRVTVLICKGASPERIKQTVEQDNRCTESEKLRILAELHLEGSMRE